MLCCVSAAAGGGAARCRACCGLRPHAILSYLHLLKTELSTELSTRLFLYGFMRSPTERYPRSSVTTCTHRSSEIASVMRCGTVIRYRRLRKQLEAKLRCLLDVPCVHDSNLVGESAQRLPRRHKAKGISRVVHPRRSRSRAWRRSQRRAARTPWPLSWGLVCTAGAARGNGGDGPLRARVR